MDESLLMAIAGGEIIFFVAIAIVLVRLWLEQKKLKQELQSLSAQLERSSGDVAGLCSAAVAVDNRLASNELRLDGLLENIAQIQEPSPPAIIEEPNEEQPQGYESAIEKIRRGASVDDLVKTCGLTRDEAVLLFRLHGKR